MSRLFDKYIRKKFFLSQVFLYNMIVMILTAVAVIVIAKAIAMCDAFSISSNKVPHSSWIWIYEHLSLRRVHKPVR
jgi:hypothetical protein